jgi:hypothetical protein
VTLQPSCSSHWLNPVLYRFLNGSRDLTEWGAAGGKRLSREITRTEPGLDPKYNLITHAASEERHRGLSDRHVRAAR